jgi:glycerol-3-phosphate dehydrogenase
VAANYCEVQGLLRTAERVRGVTAQDRLAGGRLEVRARVVVNAAGPFAEQLYVRAGLRRDQRVPFSRDMAIVIGRRLVEGRALALQTRYHDPDALFSRGRRHIFLVPWREFTLIGVNSAIYRGEPDALRVSEAEVQDFLDEINQADPGLALSLEDVSLVMAGLLPIEQGDLVAENVSFGKRPLVVDNAASDRVEGLVTAITNRYTVARAAAERSVDLAFRKMGRTPPPCRTRVSPLAGAQFTRFDDLVKEIAAAAAPGLDEGVARHLAHNYGSSYRGVLRLMREGSDGAGALGKSKVLKAQVLHAVRAEMAHRLADVVFRRTDLGTGGHPGEEALEACADLAAAELGWGTERREAELEDVRARFLGFGPRAAALETP